MSATFTDIFCGAGGSSIGLTGAGMELKLAANHWDRAIETHAANFPHADHLCADVNNYDMRRLPRTDILWASPICTEISPAGGRARRRTPAPGQGTLFDHGPVASAAFDRTRATAWDVIRATEVHRYKAVLVENVVEFATDWELFPEWLAVMTKLGYNHQTVCVSSAHVGDDDNPHAPQWRDRLYIVFTRKGIPLPDVAPRPTAWCFTCGENVQAAQWWKNPTKPPLGKYRQQYLYRCPNRGCRHEVVEPYIRPAGDIVDWSDLGQRIGDRNKPLAPKTEARIRAGLVEFAQPTVVTAAGHTYERPGSGYIRAWPAGESPLTARTCTGTDGLASMPAFLTMLRRNATASGIGDPMPTLTGAGFHHGLTVAPFLSALRSSRPRNSGIDAPMPTLLAGGGRIALVIPYRRGAAATTTGEPLHTLATRESAALVDPATSLDINDCLFRMLKPRENLRGQAFPDSYEVRGNQGEQQMQAGNAVSANVAHWLGRRVLAVLA